MKARELIKRLNENGWYEIRMNGSHRIFRHNDFKYPISVPDNRGVDINPNTLRQIYRDAGWGKP